jgi:hypothetical protein
MEHGNLKWLEQHAFTENEKTEYVKQGAPEQYDKIIVISKDE